MGNLSASISEKNKDRLEAEAEREKRSVSAQLDYILDNRYDDPEADP